MSRPTALPQSPSVTQALYLAVAIVTTVTVLRIVWHILTETLGECCCAEISRVASSAAVADVLQMKQQWFNASLSGCLPSWVFKCYLDLNCKPIFSPACNPNFFLWYGQHMDVTG